MHINLLLINNVSKKYQSESEEELEESEESDESESESEDEEDDESELISSYCNSAYLGMFWR